MGAYLSSPVTDKISCDKSCTAFTYGASSMQGWRINQEDAHNCLPDFDQESGTALFAVYDGHGGSEVAQYCSKYLPDCIKDTDQYKEGELGPALVDAFLKFDSTLVQETVIKELKLLAGVDENDEEDDDDDPVGRAEADDLRAEADLPLEVLLAKYKTSQAGAAARNLRKKENLQSPVVHSKKSAPDADARPSSSSDTGSSMCANGSGSTSMANGVADNENNQNKERELQDSAMSSSSGLKDGGDDVLTAQSNSRGEASSSNHTSSDRAGGSGDSGEGVADSSKGCGEGERCGEKGEGSGGEGGSSSTSSGQASKSTAPFADGVSSTSSMIEDEGPSASGSGSSGAGSSSSSSKGSNSGSGGSKSAKSGSQDVEMDNEDDSEEDEEDDEDEWQDIESGEDEEEDEDDEGVEDGEEPMMDMSNEEPGSDSGCTACVVMLRADQLVVANAGDSRCVLCRGGTALDLSTDHKPEDDSERQRIENAGGRVTADGRVNGGLNLSRAIGDHFYKRKEDLPPEQQMITALPDIQTAAVDPMDQFFVVACDGIWNSMSSQDCVDFIAERLKDPAKRAKPSLICEELFDHCLAENTYGDGTGCDNMTCIIVVLHPQGQPHGENGIHPSKRCVQEVDTTDDNLEKRPRVEEEEGGGEGGKGMMEEGEVTGTSSE